MVPLFMCVPCHRFRQKAVDSRNLLGQAKGILMERFEVNDGAAFQMLVRTSQDTNMKLTAVARWLTAEGSNSAQLNGDSGPR